MSAPPIHLEEHDDGRAVLHLAVAAWDAGAAEAAHGHAERLGASDAGQERVRVVTLAGDAARGRAWPAPPDPGDAAAREAMRRLTEAVAALPMPVLALLAGPVAAESLELALAADLRLAADSARFAMPHLAQGRLPACGGSVRLPRLVGRSAAWSLFVGEEWDAPRAREMGLVSEAVPDDALAATGERWAQGLAVRAPIAARLLKQAVARGLEVPLEQGLLIEEDAYLLLQTSEDRKEGIRAFLDKRPPRFRGE